MPRGLRLERSDPGPQTYPFVLTSAVGGNLYGFCLTFWEAASPEFMKTNGLYPKAPASSSVELFVPKCIGVLSLHPFYSVFREWIGQVHRYIGGKSPATMETIVTHFVLRTPLPPPRNIKIKIPIGEKWRAISQPPTDSFPLVDVSVERIASHPLVSISLRLQVSLAHQLFNGLSMSFG